MRIKRIVWILVALLLLLPSTRVQAAVVISSFTADSSSGQVRVRWETASEMDVSGFYLQRSTQSDGTYTRISNFYIGMGDGVSGYLYEYLDSGLTNGVTYFYRLEVLDTSQVSEYYGPISAVPGVATPTPTPTVTSTATPTPTTTPTQAQNTSQPTALPTRTKTLAQFASPTVEYGYPVGTPVLATPTRSFAISTPVIGAAGDQPTPSLEIPTLGTLQETVSPTPPSHWPAASSPTPAIPTVDLPLDERSVENVFDSPLVLWMGILLGGLMLGGISALVLWSLTRRLKAG